MQLAVAASVDSDCGADGLVEGFEGVRDGSGGFSHFLVEMRRF